MDLLTLNLKRLKRILYPSIFIGLIITNGLTLFNANAYNAFYSALARFVPMHWKKNSPAKKLSTRTKQVKKLQLKTQKIARRISKRTVRNISANIASIPAESIPVIGIGVVIAITALDLHDACADLKDMDELTHFVGVNNDNADTEKVCGIDLSEYTNKQ